MSTQSRPSSSRPVLTDPLLRAADVAMRRAAKRVREEARRSGKTLAVYENGKVVEKLVTESEWPEAVRQAAGAWADLDDIQPRGPG